MKDQDQQSVGLRFDETMTFADNCAALHVSLEKIDAEMAAILRDNWEALVSVVRNGERDSRARSDFNAKVAEALDALAKKPTEPKDGA